MSSIDLSTFTLSTFGIRYSSAFSINHFYINLIRGKFSIYLLFPGSSVIYFDLTANLSLCLLSLAMHNAKGRTRLNYFIIFNIKNGVR